MNKKIRKKSADEVTVEITDSEPRKKNYWNLRGKQKQQSDYDDSDTSEKLRDEIKVQFNLNENRNLTEEQKQIILNTLLQDKNSKKVSNTEDGFSNKWVIMFLLLALPWLVLAFIAASTGC